ncbi:MAG: sensor histidine kinase [Planctomycetota bacterium]|nr:sensor histidine kinase [Planctomycetota bacterium]
MDIEPGLAVRGRPARIRLILDNILANALFHSPGDGVVRLALRRDGDRILLSVRDHGPGVPERHLRDIFRAFFRVDRSRAGSGGGVGLGLALVRDAAVAMGGSVEARNAGPGLEIIVSLPPAGPDGGEGNDARFSADPGEERGGP